MQILIHTDLVNLSKTSANAKNKTKNIYVTPYPMGYGLSQLYR